MERMSLLSGKQLCMHGDKWQLGSGLRTREAVGRSGEWGEPEHPFQTLPPPVDCCRADGRPSPVKSSSALKEVGIWVFM